MRNIVIQTIVFLVCFFGGIFVINLCMNSNAGDYTSEMDQATLPLVYTRVEGEKINCLRGYTSDIDASLLRDSVTPLEGTETVKLLIDTDEQEISDLHYEVRSSDASSLVEDGDITDFKKDKHGDLQTEIVVRMQLKEGQDYILKLVLSGEGGVDTTYYTRIVFGQNMHVKEQLDFVKNFNQVVFDKNDAESIQQYLECDPAKTSNNLGLVTITSSFEAITFADMKPQKVAEPIPTITDIDGDIACVQMRYVVNAESTGENTEYYDVVEDYKVRYTDTRMYLLSYNRTMESIYDKVFTSTSNNSLKLGITTDSEVPYLVSEDCKLAAFVKNRELYCYDYQNTQITRVFSFRQENVADVRDGYNQHNIKLIHMDAEGNLAFAVYGYMNRGRHEGQNGILFYRYKKEENQIEEIAFIPSSQPYSALAEDIGQVAYMNGDDEIFLTLEGELYHVDVKKNEIETIMSNVTSDTVVSSADFHLIASLADTDISKNHSITVRNLETGEEQVVDAAAGEVLRVIGFVDDDLVYGKVKERDIVKRDSQTTVYPMYEIEIMDKDGNVVKNYKPSGAKKFVLSASVNHNLVEMNLARYNGDTFQEKGSDYIMSSDEEDGSSVILDYTYNSVRYKELNLVFPNYIYLNAVPELTVTKETRMDGNRTVEIQGESGILRYFVYMNGTISDSYNDVSTAIAKADEQSGGVVNSKHKTVWEKSGIQEYATVGDDVATVRASKKKDSKEACVAMILSYEEKDTALTELIEQKKDADELLEAYLQKDGVNLTGCTLDEVMYYICQGHPVIAKNKEGYYVLLTSFNSSLLKYTDPVTGEVERKSFDTMRQEFKDAGNVFYSYLK